jgi:hypothetical protein
VEVCFESPRKNVSVKKGSLSQYSYGGMVYD